VSTWLRLLGIVLLFAWTAFPAAIAADEAPTLADIVGAPALGEPMDPEAARVEGARIGKGLRCPVCQGLSVSDSPSEAARAALQRVQDLLIAGYTEEQIEDYFVDRYGEWALLAPRASGLNWIVWLAPIFGLLLGVWVIARRLSSTESCVPAAAKPGPSEGAAPDDVDPYAHEVLRALEERKR